MDENNIIHPNFPKPPRLESVKAVAQRNPLAADIPMAVLDEAVKTRLLDNGINTTYRDFLERTLTRAVRLAGFLATAAEAASYAPSGTLDPYQLEEMALAVRDEIEIARTVFGELCEGISNRGAQ